MGHPAFTAKTQSDLHHRGHGGRRDNLLHRKGAKKLQVPPLRYAPVGMTRCFGFARSASRWTRSPLYVEFEEENVSVADYVFFAFGAVEAFFLNCLLAA
jgi:hypothetical protein